MPSNPGEWLESTLEAIGVRALPITFEDTLQAFALPEASHEWFSRLVAAQAMSKCATLVTMDRAFERYGMKAVFI